MTLYLGMESMATVQLAGINLSHFLVTDNACVLIIFSRGKHRGRGHSHRGAWFLGGKEETDHKVAMYIHTHAQKTTISSDVVMSLYSPQIHVHHVVMI